MNVAAGARITEIGAVDWAEVYEHVRPSLVRALAVSAGTYDGVEDAIHDAFADAISRAPADLRSPEAWLYAVALNKLRSHRRRAAIAARLRLAPPAAHELDDALLRADVTRLLLALPRRERELLVAKHYVGMTQEEIARYLGVPRGTVSSAISRAAARFRELEGTK